MLYKGGTFLEVVNSIWLFFQDQILGMKWLNGLIGNGLSQLGLDIDSRLGGSIQFFLYDVIKITILLCLLIFFISYIQSYFPPERSKKILGRFHGIGANIISALLGTVTPFCSCSSIPLFIGFTSAGLPLVHQIIINWLYLDLILHQQPALLLDLFHQAYMSSDKQQAPC